MEAGNSIKMAGRRLPLLGHSVAMLRDPLGFLASLPSYGELVRIRFGLAEVVAVCDPGLTRQALLDDRTFDRGGPLYGRLAELVGGNGLGTCPQSAHRRQRRLCQPAFRRERIAAYSSSMAAQIAARSDAWQDGQVLDVSPEIKRMTISALVRTMFSGQLSPLMLRQTADDLTVMVSGVYWLVVLPKVLSRVPTPGKRRFDAAMARLRRTVDSIISDRRTGGSARDDLMSTLMSAVEPSDGAGLSDSEIRDQVFSFLVSGSETAASTIAWALHLVSQHPEIEARLQSEVDSVLAGEPAKFEHLDQLYLTRRIITEALRLYPPGWIFTRVVTTDTRLGGHCLPVGTAVCYSPYLIHHRCDLFDRPEEFDPDRWPAGRSPSAPGDTFIAFGAGPRKCIGEQFGMAECMLALATIAAKWNLHPASRVPVKPDLAAELRPKGLRLRVTLRTPRDR